LSAKQKESVIKAELKRCILLVVVVVVVVIVIVVVVGISVAIGRIFSLCACDVA